MSQEPHTHKANRGSGSCLLGGHNHSAFFLHWSTYAYPYMSDAHSPAKKKSGSPSPKKKGSGKKRLVKSDYSGISFTKPDTTNEDDDAAADDAAPEDDPLMTYRLAAAAAREAAIKEREEEAQLALYRKIFAAMDTDGDGKVELAAMVEAVAAGTAPLSHRAQSTARPAGAVALQLPMTFGLEQWIKEMRRMSKEMDKQTFEQNVLGLFACFRDAEERQPTTTEAAASSSASEPALDRTAMLRELFNTMDIDHDGLIGVDDFLKQARSSDEATALAALFDFFDSTFGKNDKQLSFEAFAEGTLTKTPLGRVSDSSFASAVRGMQADVDRALALKASADKRLNLLEKLFVALDTANDGVVDMDEFIAQAKSKAEAEELKVNFEAFDKASGAPDGMLTFRKFAAGTMQHTPLGKMKDERFEKAMTGMIADAEAKAAPTVE